MTDFGLKLEPAERVVIANKKLGEEPANTTLKIKNNGKDRYAFKVKCTNTKAFGVKPATGILCSGEEKSIAISLIGDKFLLESDVDFVSIYFFKVPQHSRFDFQFPSSLRKVMRYFFCGNKEEPIAVEQVYVEVEKEKDYGSLDSLLDEKDINTAKMPPSDPIFDEKYEKSLENGNDNALKKIKKKPRAVNVNNIKKQDKVASFNSVQKTQSSSSSKNNFAKVQIGSSRIDSSLKIDATLKSSSSEESSSKKKG
uniref:Major sperm protein n=1 Tax=Panagrolaimus sp. ES5 TaxID=591445 RepID=A0AC34FMG6_9BILA